MFISNLNSDRHKSKIYYLFFEFLEFTRKITYVMNFFRFSLKFIEKNILMNTFRLYLLKLYLIVLIFNLKKKQLQLFLLNPKSKR